MSGISEFAARAEAMIAARDARIEYLCEHLQRIVEWSEAYPGTAFPEPDLKRAHELLQAGGMTLDAISAHAMRHVVKGVGEIARCGLKAEK